jgi:hypothetical protein
MIWREIQVTMIRILINTSDMPVETQRVYLDNSQLQKDKNTGAVLPRIVLALSSRQGFHLIITRTA